MPAWPKCERILVLTAGGFLLVYIEIPRAFMSDEAIDLDHRAWITVPFRLFDPLNKPIFDFFCKSVLFFLIKLLDHRLRKSWYRPLFFQSTISAALLLLFELLSYFAAHILLLLLIVIQSPIKLLFIDSFAVIMTICMNLILLRFFQRLLVHLVLRYHLVIQNMVLHVLIYFCFLLVR